MTGPAQRAVTMPARRAVVATAAVVSAALLVWLAYGYVGMLGLLYGYDSRVGPAVDECSLFVYVDQGLVYATWRYFPLSSGNPRLLQQGLHVQWLYAPPGLTARRMRNWAWFFRARTFGSAVAKSHEVVCSTWMVAVPCMVAPALWWRSRPRREPAAFAVVVPGGSPP